MVRCNLETTSKPVGEGAPRLQHFLISSENVPQSSNNAFQCLLKMTSVSNYLSDQICDFQKFRCMWRPSANDAIPSLLELTLTRSRLFQVLRYLLKVPGVPTYATIWPPFTPFESCCKHHERDNVIVIENQFVRTRQCD